MKDNLTRFRLFLGSDLHLNAMALGPQQPSRLYFAEEIKIQRSNVPGLQIQWVASQGSGHAESLGRLPSALHNPRPEHATPLFPVCAPSVFLNTVSSPWKSFVLLSFPNSLPPPFSLNADLSRCSPDSPSNFLCPFWQMSLT